MKMLRELSLNVFLFQIYIIGDVYNRSNIKMMDRLAKKTISQVVKSYEEYFVEVLKEISSNPKAIGYLESGDVTDSVRVLATF